MEQNFNTIELNAPGQFSFRECLWFLDRNLDDCMHTVTGNSVLKAIRTKSGPVLFSVTGNDDRICIRILKGPRNAATEVTDYVRRWFDLDRDLSKFYELLEADEQLAPLGSDYFGLRLVGIPDLFETLCWCVIGQQINLSFAYQVKSDLVERYGENILFRHHTYRLFPQAETLASLHTDELRQLRLTTRKAEYIQGIAQAFVTGTLSEAMFAALNEEQARVELMQVRGIGEWTANYAVMKALRGMNCVPYGDSGINQALLKWKHIPARNNREQVESLFNKFSGWKSYLVYYLWRSLRNPS